MKIDKIIKLTFFHGIIFSVFAVLSIFGSLILTHFSAWNFVIGLMDLAALGSYDEFAMWFPKWGHAFFFILLLLKILFFTFILFLAKKEIKYWKKIKIDQERINLKKDFLIGIYLTVGLLILYSIGWLILFQMNVGGERSLELRIIFSRGFLFQLSVQTIRYIFNNRDRIKNFLSYFLFEPASPYSLSILRILFFGYLIFIYSAKLSTVLPIVDLEQRESLPFIGWLVHSIPINSVLYRIIASIGILTSIFVVIGWRTSFFMFINAITIFYVMATPNFFGKLWHEQIVIWISWIMALSNASDAWSLDSLFKKRTVINSGEYTWPIKLVWLHFGLIYFWAGFYKIWDAGFDWALSESMINQVQLEWLQHYDKIPEIRIDQQPILLHFGGLLVILFELLFPIFILIKSWRWIAFFGGLLMHNLLGYFLYISFLHFLQVFYAYFVNFNWLLKNKIKEVGPKIEFGRKVKIGFIILGLNTIAGMFNINSYPFSAYPKYSALIPNKIQFIRFNTQKNGINSFIEAKNSGFRWEDYGWLEYEIINNRKDGKPIKKEINDYWKIWKSKIKSLKNCQYIVVELCERSVKPEGKNQLIVLDTLTIIKE